MFHKQLFVFWQHVVEKNRNKVNIFNFIFFDCDYNEESSYSKFFDYWNIRVDVINFFLLMKFLNNSTSFIMFDFIIFINFYFEHLSFVKSFTFFKQLSESKNVFFFNIFHLIIHDFFSLSDLWKRESFSIKIENFDIINMSKITD